MNYAVQPYKVPEGMFPLGINVRNRYNVFETVRKPLLDTVGLPNDGEDLQGLYAAGQFALAFKQGKAYYKNYAVEGAAWIEIAGFPQMSTDAERIYAVLVPSSSLKYNRNAGSSPTAAITLTGSRSGTPQSIVVQDGINQPRIINADLTSRIAGTWGSWTVANPEYIPIGKQMLFYGSRLYIVDPSGVNIFRSVTGAPLDFMVAIAADGSKLASEQVGGATAVSHAVDFDPITCIAPSNDNDGSFFVSTAKASYLVQPNFESTRFAEPTFNNTPIFPTGAVNQFSFVQVTGDNVFIDAVGVRSFNAVLQTRNESRNSAFSSKIYPFFEGVDQTNNASIVFNDRALFGVQTIFGRAVLVYDTLREAWESIDFWTFASPTEYVKQFAEIKTVNGVKTLLIMTDKQIYVAYSGEEREMAQVYLGDFSSGDLTIEQKPDILSLLFNDTRESGTVSAYVYSDGYKNDELSSPLVLTVPADEIPITPPFGNSSRDFSKNISFNLNAVKQAYRVGFWISWNFNATFNQLDYTANQIKLKNSMEETVREEEAYRAGVPTVEAITPSEGIVGTVVTLVGQHLDNVSTIEIDGEVCTIQSQVESQIQLIIPDTVSNGIHSFTISNSTIIFVTSEQFTVLPA